MSLKETLTAYWLHIQEELLPWLGTIRRAAR